MSDKKSEKSPLLQATSSYESARAAYNNVDPDFSREIHDSRTPENLEGECHQEGGGYLKSVVFGGLDGTLTIFAIVAGLYLLSSFISFFQYIVGMMMHRYFSNL
jgi:hypothetical protein